jgi:hypothetical protein
MPRLRASGEGLRRTPWKVMDGERTLDRCCGVPIKRYSVLERLTDKRFEVSHEWVWSRADVSFKREAVRSAAEKEMYS